jgi:hypothetical protein
MDPYIEHPEVWSDFHGDLAAEIRAELNRVIQPRYVGRLMPRMTYEVVEIGEMRGVGPDVGVWQPRPASEQAGGVVAVISAAPVESLVAMELPLRLFTVEVWPIQLRDGLPTVPVPLLERDPDAPLDLAGVVAAVYERGAYARLIDYCQPPPPPPLSDAEAAWLDEHLRAQKAR